LILIHEISPHTHTHTLIFDR